MSIVTVEVSVNTDVSDLHVSIVVEVAASVSTSAEGNVALNASEPEKVSPSHNDRRDLAPRTR